MRAAFHFTNGTADEFLFPIGNLMERIARQSPLNIFHSSANLINCFHGVKPALLVNG